MRLAVLADIHGNLPALEAVLADLDAERPDAIAVAGDLIPGPFPTECLAALRARPEPIHWVKGNGERDIVQTYDGHEDDDERRIRRHNAATLTRADRDEIDGWPIALAVDGVCVCHGSPRSEDEMLTRGTPDDALREALTGVGESLVIGGHTHQQMVRRVAGAPAYANAGSIGMPYEGDAAAFWMVVRNGVPELRRTAYDVKAAIERMRAGDYPSLQDDIEGSLTKLVDPDWVTAYFEHLAGRGGDPGPERLLS